MKTLLTRILAVSALALLALPAAFGAEGWGDNLQKAQDEAKAKNKLLLMDFTGSDWCGWCIKLNKEVFSQPEFKDYAAKNLVLMEVDFPQTKQLPGNVK